MSPPIKEHDLVSLTRDLPNEGLVAGVIGTVIHLYGDKQACEVEFQFLRQKPKVITLLFDQVEPYFAKTP